jgi:hypothetical protein
MGFAGRCARKLIGIRNGGPVIVHRQPLLVRGVMVYLNKIKTA